MTDIKDVTKTMDLMRGCDPLGSLGVAAASRLAYIDTQREPSKGWPDDDG